MKKILAVICSTFFALSACNKMGSSRITQLIDFTPALEADSSAAAIKVALDQPSSVNEWHNHINAVNEQPRHIKLDSNITKLISSKLGSSKISTPPIIAGSSIYVLDNKDFVSSFNINSFKKQWSVNISPYSKKKEYPGGGIVYQNGKIAIAGGSRDIVVLDAKDGSEIFRKTLSDLTKTQPIIDGNKLMVLTVSNILYALDMKSGSTLWQHEALPEVLVGGRYIAPILYKDKVIVTYSSGTVYLINAHNGEQEWGLNLAAESNELAGFAAMNVEVQPVVEGNNLYIASNSGNLFKIALSNGEIIWRKTIQDIKALSHCGNMLYIVTNAKQMAAISKENGLVKWTLSLRSEKDNKHAKAVAYSNPLVINNIIYFTTSDGDLFKADPASGTLIERTSILSGAISQAVAQNKYFIFTTTSNVLRSAN
jgi:outer membrane protein assembly factor BamB